MVTEEKAAGQLQRMLKGKRARADTSSPLTSTAPPEATASGTSGESSETPSRSVQDTAGAHQPTEEALDESLHIPIATQSSDDDSSDDGSSESSDKFSSDDARQAYEKWVKEQPKHNIKMMAVMFTDVLISRFNMTACGAANEVGLVLSYNEKTVHKWRQNFYSNQGTSQNQSRENMPASSF